MCASRNSVPLQLFKKTKLSEVQQSFILFYLFNNEPATRKDVIRAGEQILVTLYNGQAHETLDILRYWRFCDKVASCSSSVEVPTLSPTSSASKFRTVRVYLQVQEWIGNKLEPQGWTVANKIHKPTDHQHHK